MRTASMRDRSPTGKGSGQDWFVVPTRQGSKRESQSSVMQRSPARIRPMTTSRKAGQRKNVRTSLRSSKVREVVWWTIGIRCLGRVQGFIPGRSNRRSGCRILQILLRSFGSRGSCQALDASSCLISPITHSYTSGQLIDRIIATTSSFEM